MKVLDLFCGAGGLSKGFELAGFEVVGGVDFNQSAIDTYNKNFPNAKGYCCDLMNMEKEDIKNQFGDLKDVDVIIGGPPCQGFSSANRQQNEMNDPRNKLFFQFLKFVEMAEPSAVIIENVRGIVTKDNGYAKNRIYELFEERGYSVNHQVLDASDYGVPQKRLRNFFVMIKGNKENKFDFNTMNKVAHKFTVKEAIGDIDNCYPDVDVNNDFLKQMRNAEKLENHNPKFPNDKVVERMKHVPEGGNWKDVPAELWDTQRDNRHSSAYKRLASNEPSITIDTGHMNYFHPLYHRIPTVRESARLQSFPDNFVFLGNQGAQFRQVGNAVPPLLAKAVGEAVKKMITGENNEC